MIVLARSVNVTLQVGLRSLQFMWEIVVKSYFRPECDWWWYMQCLQYTPNFWGRKLERRFHPFHPQSVWVNFLIFHLIILSHVPPYYLQQTYIWLYQRDQWIRSRPDITFLAGKKPGRQFGRTFSWLDDYSTGRMTMLFCRSNDRSAAARWPGYD